MSDCIERMRVLQELQKIGGCGAAAGHVVGRLGQGY